MIQRAVQSLKLVTVSKVSFESNDVWEGWGGDVLGHVFAPLQVPFGGLHGPRRSLSAMCKQFLKK